MIDELRRLLGEATPGPVEARGNRVRHVGRGMGSELQGGARGVFDDPAEAALYVALRNHAPSLLARLEAAEAVVESSREWGGYCREVYGYAIDAAEGRHRHRTTCAHCLADDAHDAALAHYDAVRKETRDGG